MRLPRRPASPAAPTAPCLLALSAACVLSAACDERPGMDAASMGPTWRWRAVNMELSALTTPIRPSAGAGPALDVRAEFFDTERDETKALGQLGVRVLFDANEVGRASADLAGLGGHARAWDGVTETYSLRIPLSVEPPPGRVLVVQATFEGVDGARMTASREVRWPETAQ